MSLVIYGPQGCGKTRNALRLAAHFGLSHIIDEWQPGDLLPPDTLALTNAESVPGGIAFPAAMAELDMPSDEAKRRSAFPHCPWPSCRGAKVRAPYTASAVRCACLGAAIEPGPPEINAVRSFVECTQRKFSARAQGPQGCHPRPASPTATNARGTLRTAARMLALFALGFVAGWFAGSP
jgi:hypothetical protein